MFQRYQKVTQKHTIVRGPQMILIAYRGIFPMRYVETQTKLMKSENPSIG